MRKEGFTILELIIVTGIAALLSAMAIGFSAIGQNQVTLSVESAKVAQTIVRAKDLSVATYNLGSAICGYGVEFNQIQGTYSLFAYAPPGAPPCPDAASVTSTPASDRMMVSSSTSDISFAKAIVMQAMPDSLAVVLFYPPAPSVFISRNYASGTFTGANNLTSYVHLATIDGGTTTTVTVNTAGQITF